MHSVVVNYNSAGQRRCDHHRSTTGPGSKSCLRRIDMKTVRVALSVVLLALATAAFAQSDAQKSFDQLKTLAGTWEGHIATVPPDTQIEGKTVQLSLRVTSMGNAL